MLWGQIRLIFVPDWYGKFMTMKKLGVSNSFDEGHRAYRHGRGKEDNPYPKGDLDHENWEEGRREASHETTQKTVKRSKL